jgi:hypothetical protein
VVFLQPKKRGEPMKIKVNNTVVFFPPVIVHSKSKDIGAAGFEYRGIIGVADDFTSWFKSMVLVHEFIHYIANFFPNKIQKIGHYINDKVLVKIAYFLSSEERNRGRLNMRQFLVNCWTVKVHFFPEYTN